MAIVVQITGALLALCGLVGLVYGIDMLPTERGVAGVISSVVALTGGLITAALGLVIQRLETLISGGVRTVAPRIEAAPAQCDEPARPLVVPSAERAQRPRIEPRMASEEVELPKLPVVEHDVADIRPPDVKMPDVRAPEPPQPVRSKSSLPSFKFGAGAVAAGAAAGVAAGVTLAKAAGDKAGDAASAAADRLADTAAPVVDVATSVRPAAEYVDPPVEVLTPVDDLPADVQPEPMPDLSAYAVVPMPEDLVTEQLPPEVPANAPEAEPQAPVPIPVVARPVEDDPFASFEQELDKLMPLKPARKDKDKAKDKGKDKRDGAPEMSAVTMIEPVIVPAPEPVVTAPDSGAIPAEVYADAADLAPPPPAPAQGAEIVGAYESGGAKYTMYSDGSVVAEAEGQKLFFKSLEELREFIDGGVKG